MLRRALALVALLLSLIVAACTGQPATAPTDAPAAAPSPAAATPTAAVAPIPNTLTVLFPTPAPDPTTTVILYRPPAAPPDREVEGECWAGSSAAPRAGAWRCTSGAVTSDPCFAEDAQAKSVRCVASPASKQPVTKMNLTKPLPAPPPAAESERPWAYLLHDDAVCVFQEGAMRTLEGQRLNYACSDGWVVFGDPTPGPLWTVTKTKLKDDGAFEQTIPANIVTVWR